MTTYQDRIDSISTFNLDEIESIEMRNAVTDIIDAQGHVIHRAPRHKEITIRSKKGVTIEIKTNDFVITNGVKLPTKEELKKHPRR